MTNGSNGGTVPATENEAMADLIEAQARVITSQASLILYYQDLVNATNANAAPASAHLQGAPQSH